MVDVGLGEGKRLNVIRYGEEERGGREEGLIFDLKRGLGGRRTEVRVFHLPALGHG